jgi:CubicO group peptidase (beta-lactamase class C family)
MARPRGFSQTRLDRMHDLLSVHVVRGAVPGLVTALSRHGEVRVDAIGTKAMGGDEPIRRDTIFRITSMTKPITAAAAMILVEESKLRVDEPVDRLLPELACRKVLTRLDGPLSETVPANRPITLRDLLTFRVGLGIIMEPSAEYPIQKALNGLQLVGFGPPNVAVAYDSDEWMRRLGTLPLMHQPGEKWMYNTGSYLLGVLIARAAGQPLETFLRERIFSRLGMKDTSFSVPADKLGRLASSYRSNAQTGALELHDGATNSQWSRPPTFPDGGAGLVSTVDDYLAFGQMLLNGGTHGRERILSRPSVEAMTTNYITPEQKAGSEMVLDETRGWGFGLAIVTRNDEVSPIPGRFGWDGGYGTSWASDPNQEMVAIFMSQRLWDSPAGPIVHRDFWTSAYQAIRD